MRRATLATIAPFGYDADPRAFLEARRLLGCERCQFSRNPAKPPPIREALAMVESVGMSFDSIHGLFGPDLDPSSPDPDLRKHCLTVYESEARLALELGAPMVVVHPCRSSPQRVDPPPKPLPIDEARRQQRERWPHLHHFLVRLADIGHRLNVTFLIENLMYDCPLGHDPVQLAERIMAVRSPRIRMCLDTGHAHATLARHTAAGSGAVALAMRICAPAIGYLHLHDNDGVRDQHLMPGRGGPTGIDWNAVGEVLRNSEIGATRMLEVFEDPALSGPPQQLASWLGEWFGV